MLLNNKFTTFFTVCACVPLARPSNSTFVTEQESEVKGNFPRMFGLGFQVWHIAIFLERGGLWYDIATFFGDSKSARF